MPDERIAKMLLNPCGKLSQGTNLYHLSAVREPGFFFLLSLLPTEQLVSSSDLISGEMACILEMCQRLLRICQKHECFRRLVSTAYICLELYKPGSASVVFLN